MKILVEQSDLDMVMETLRLQSWFHLSTDTRSALSRLTAAIEEAKKPVEKDGLLPCPFCGGTARITKTRGPVPTWAVMCETSFVDSTDEEYDKMCKISPGRYAFYSEREAIEVWNTRSPQPEIVRPEKQLARIAEIIEAVDDRCMAADGPVTPTLQEMTQAEISEIYRLASNKDGEE